MISSGLNNGQWWVVGGVGWLVTGWWKVGGGVWGHGTGQIDKTLAICKRMTREDVRANSCI